MMQALLGLALLTAPAGAPAEPATQLAGLYEIRQMEMAGGLELQPGGRFRYALEYGAVSEQGEGDWTVEGDTVRLTSNPKPKPPGFELVSDAPAPAGELTVTLEPPGFGWSGNLDLVATVAGQADPVGLEADSDGRVSLDGAVPTSIRPVVPIYGFLGDPIAIKPGGHRIMLRFKPNDLGKALFDREPLLIKGGNLLMQRYDAVITFRRAEQ